MPETHARLHHSATFASLCADYTLMFIQEGTWHHQQTSQSRDDSGAIKFYSKAEPWHSVLGYTYIKLSCFRRRSQGPVNAKVSSWRVCPCQAHRRDIYLNLCLKLNGYPDGSAASGDTGEPAQPLPSSCSSEVPLGALAAVVCFGSALAGGVRFGSGTFISFISVASTSAAVGRARGSGTMQACTRSATPCGHSSGTLRGRHMQL